MRALPTTVVVIVGMLLAGCAAEAEPSTAPSESAAADPIPSASAEPAVEAFAMPSACLEILPSSRLAALESSGIVLLGGPDGLYGDDYLLDPSPEQRAGGITCIWGPPDTELSSVTVSVAPLRADARAAIINDLAVTQGLNETVGDEATYYWKIGDRDGHPAILNVLTADSWVSIIQTIGGTDSYSEAEELAAEVHELVYS